MEAGPGPVQAGRAKLVNESLATSFDLEEIGAAAAKEAEEIEARCLESPKATPPISELLQSVYAA